RRCRNRENQIATVQGVSGRRGGIRHGTARWAVQNRSMISHVARTGAVRTARRVDHDAEGTVPLHKFGCALIDALLDEVEVEDKVEGGDGDDEEADGDANGAGAVDGDEVDAKEAED